MSSRGLVLFLTVAVLWGVPYLFIAEALDAGVGPLSVAGSRISIGLLALLAVTGAGSFRLLRRHPVRLTVLGLVEVAVPFSLISAGETSVSSATAGVLIALVPLFSLGFTALVTRRRQPWARALIGSLVGFCGVLALLGAPGGGAGAWLIVCAAVCYGLGAVLVGHWFADAPSLPLAAGTLLVAAPVTLTAGLLADGPPPLNPQAVSSLIVLGLACTAGGLAAFYGLIREVGSHGATLITYAAPLVALAVGLLFRDEQLGALTLAGTALILAGAWIVLHRRRTPAAPGTDP